MTNPIPPSLYTALISELLGKMWYFDEGVFLGRIASLDVVGEHIVASKSGDRGIIYCNVDRNLDEADELGAQQISGEFTPTTDGFEVPLNSISSLSQGSMIWNGSTGKISFSSAATFNVFGTTSASWVDSEVCAGIRKMGYLMRCAHYNSANVLQSTKDSMSYYLAECGVSIDSFSKFMGVYTVSVGDYLLVTVGPTTVGTGVYPTSIKYSISANELVKYV